MRLIIKWTVYVLLIAIVVTIFMALLYVFIDIARNQ